MKIWFLNILNDTDDNFAISGTSLVTMVTVSSVSFVFLRRESGKLTGLLHTKNSLHVKQNLFLAQTISKFLSQWRLVEWLLESTQISLMSHQYDLYFIVCCQWVLLLSLYWYYSGEGIILIFPLFSHHVRSPN